MTPFFRAWSQRAAAVVVAVLLFVIGFLPLFGGPGYEHALACGLVLPAAAAIASALDVARAGKSASPLSLVARGISSGLALALVGFATAMVHGLRVGFCDLAGGARGYVLTAAVGAVMGGVWGAFAGLLARRTRRTRLACVLLGLAGPVAGIAISLGRFYATPMVFAFDPFFGYFSGTLYDTVIDAGTPLLVYRLGSLCTLSAVVLLASILVRNEEGALRFATLRRAPGAAGARARLALGTCLAAASLGITIRGAALGHWSTSKTIADELGGRRSGARCDVVYPDGEREEQIALLLKDCEEEIAHDETVMGTHFTGRLTAFFFRDAGEKKRLMGAADTYVAKPWRREVYLQVHSYPHPVLGHEIAHVVAGEFGRGPFRIAGARGGWWPNPGLIEGVAVAASPDEEELTNPQWAHAMMDLGILPPMRRVFSLGFLGDASAKSYALAGAFVTWVAERWGAGVVRQWYGGGDLTRLAGSGWDGLEAGFREWIGSKPLAPDALAYAKARFNRPSVFGRTCPHVIDALRGEADHCRDSLQVNRARALYDRVLVRDPHDWAARLGQGAMELRFGDAVVGATDLRALADDTLVPRPWRDRSAEMLADVLLASHEPRMWEEARDSYAALASRAIDEDVGRTLEVKAYAATRPAGRDAIAALLVGRPGRLVDQEEALARIAAWAEAERAQSPPGDGVAEYVLGKNLTNREFWAEAAEHFDRAIEIGEPTDRIGRELLKERAVCACAVDDVQKARQVRAHVVAGDGAFARSEGRKAWLLSFLARCGAGEP